MGQSERKIEFEMVTILKKLQEYFTRPFGTIISLCLAVCFYFIFFS